MNYVSEGDHCRDKLTVSFTCGWKIYVEEQIKKKNCFKSFIFDNLMSIFNLYFYVKSLIYVKLISVCWSYDTC